MLRRKLIPVSDTYDGDKFFVVKEGVKMATPLLLALAVIEISDVAFAVDSIPAVCPLPSPALVRLPDPCNMHPCQPTSDSSGSHRSPISVNQAWQVLGIEEGTVARPVRHASPSCLPDYMVPTSLCFSLHVRVL